MNLPLVAGMEEFFSNFISNDRINIAENTASSFISFVNKNLGTTAGLAANSSLAFSFSSFVSNTMKNVTEVVSNTNLSVENSMKAISQTQANIIGSLPSVEGIGGESFTSDNFKDALASLSSSITESLTTAVAAKTSLHLADSGASMNFLRASLANSIARALTKIQKIFPRVSSLEGMTIEGLTEKYLSGIGTFLEASSLFGANLNKISKACLSFVQLSKSMCRG